MVTLTTMKITTQCGLANPFKRLVLYQISSRTSGLICTYDVAPCQRSSCEFIAGRLNNDNVVMTMW